MRDSTKRFYQTAIRAAAEQVVRSLDRAIDLAELAALADVSPLHFHRMFRGMLAETPLELHRRLRLERAAYQLAASDDPVTMIAFDAGFETHESFTRAFQSAHAQAPSAFRKRMLLHRERMNFAERFPFELPARNGIHFRAADFAELTLDDGGEDMDVIVERMPERRVLAVTHVGPNNMVGEAFGRLARIAGPAGLMGPPNLAVAIFHDDPETTPAAEQRSSVGLIVAANVTAPAGLDETSIPAGTYARITHRGHYANIRDTWDKLMGQWLPQSGHRVTSRYAFEIYRVADHSKPDELETDLYVAVA